uniref:Uncharacterized protein n=1 Tax=Rhizophora mucronata TaxID=61149 RepID=A0A2P2PLX7_RHIMU
MLRSEILQRSSKFQIMAKKSCDFPLPFFFFLLLLAQKSFNKPENEANQGKCSQNFNMLQVYWHQICLNSPVKAKTRISPFGHRF